MRNLLFNVAISCRDGQPVYCVVLGASRRYRKCPCSEQGGAFTSSPYIQRLQPVY